MRAFFIALICFSISGCASGGKQFSPLGNTEKDKALVYVYHPSDYRCQHHGDQNFLFINDKRIFRFSCNTYTALFLNPGTYRFAIKANVFYIPAYEKSGAQTYLFEKAKTYYIRYSENLAFIDRATVMAIAITNANIEKIEGDRPPPDIADTSYLEPNTTSLD